MGCMAVSAQGQFYIVEGKILDRETKAPLQGASVFAQNTTLGTATGPDGNFKLYLPNGGYDLVITFTGYSTETKRVTTADADNKNLIIEIGRKEKAMEEVAIRSSNEVKDGWDKYGELFLENFIGKTGNGKYCSIVNKDAVKFYFSKKKNRLKVLADSAIQIQNLALGYNIKVALDSFTYEFSNGTSMYSGYPLFEEMQPLNADQGVTWAANRMAAYKGSMLHFMRSLYNRQLREEGFEIQFLININDTDSAFKLKEFYPALNYNRDDSTQTVEILPNQPQVALLYKKEIPEAMYLAANPDQPEKFQLSVLAFTPKQPVIIEQNGYYFEQSDIIINQYLGWKKMADMLPYDFKVQ